MRASASHSGRLRSGLFRSEGELGQRVDGHGRIRVPRFEILDDEHDAVHADPVPGEGADKDVLARLGRRGEAQALGLAFLDEPGREEHRRQVGHEGLRLRVRGHGHAPTGRADRLERTGLAHNQVVRHRVGVEEHNLHGLAGLDGEPLDVETELLGKRLDAHDLHAERAQIAPDGALRVVGQLRRQLLAELDRVEGLGLGPAIGRSGLDDGDDGTSERFERGWRPRAVGNPLQRRDRGRARGRGGVRFDLTRQQLERGGVRAGPPEGVERRRPRGGILR